MLTYPLWKKIFFQSATCGQNKFSTFFAYIITNRGGGSRAGAGDGMKQDKQYLHVTLASDSSSERNLEKGLNLNTINSTWHSCTHSHTPHLSSSLYRCDHCVCVRVDAEGRLFLSQKSQGFELFMKRNQARVKAFPLRFSSPCFGARVRVCLFVRRHQRQPRQVELAVSRLSIVYCLFRCRHAPARNGC